MLRFVILEHDHPIVHWDLMLEAGEVLHAWRLALPPEQHAGPIDATELGDHRIAYLDYEGPVSGDRGTVKRWDVGGFIEAPESTAETRILLLEGTRINGRFRLRRVDALTWHFQCLAK